MEKYVGKKWMNFNKIRLKHWCVGLVLFFKVHQSACHGHLKLFFFGLKLTGSGFGIYAVWYVAKERPFLYQDKQYEVSLECKL